jgi:hypothetical protein
MSPTVLIICIALALIALILLSTFPRPRPPGRDQTFRPRLENLERRDTPTPIVPQTDVFYLSGSNYGKYDPTVQFMAQRDGGSVVSSEVVPYSFGNSPQQIASSLKLAFLLDPGLYHGPNTIVVVVMPDGQGISGVPASNISAHSAFSPFGGTIPYTMIPFWADGVFPGASYDFEASRVDFNADPRPVPDDLIDVPGFGPVSYSRPLSGPDGSQSVKQPSLLLEYLVLDYFFIQLSRIT